MTPEMARQVELSQKVQMIALEAVRNAKSLDVSSCDGVFIARAMVREVAWQLIGKLENQEYAIVDELELVRDEISQTALKAIKLVTLYRPVGQKELDLIERNEFKSFPPRLPEQPIFYPVTNEEYACQIARDWNTKFNEERVGYVTKFVLPADYLAQFERKIVGGAEHEELWVPAEQLVEFNLKIVGKIEVIHKFTEADRHKVERGVEQ